MDIIIRDNYDHMSKYAAEVIAGFVKKKPDCVIGLVAGHTPIGTYRELIRMHHDGLDFSRVTTFNLDEYFGLGIDLKKPYSKDPSHARFMHEELFKHINVKPENIHLPDGTTKNPIKFCQAYEEEIIKAGGIDIQLLGLGSDGHWGFNEPGTSLASRTHLHALTEQTLNDNFEEFYRKNNLDRSQMPFFAITMGVGTVLDTRNIIMMVNGAKKADILAKCLEGPVTSQVTSSAVQLHCGNIVVVLDEPAAAKLSNIEYYKHVEIMKRQYGL